MGVFIPFHSLSSETGRKIKMQLLSWVDTWLALGSSLPSSKTSIFRLGQSFSVDVVQGKKFGDSTEISWLWRRSLTCYFSYHLGLRFASGIKKALPFVFVVSDYKENDRNPVTGFHVT